MGERGATALADSGESGVRQERVLVFAPVLLTPALELLPLDVVVLESLLLLEEFDVTVKQK